MKNFLNATNTAACCAKPIGNATFASVLFFAFVVDFPHNNPSLFFVLLSRGGIIWMVAPQVIFFR